ncbi:hypothetical protein KEM48_006198 [Puccinia striiformis f. sp. tritici PST-130]|nr:hypothetical protein KEM48_006198 [Puccinia striiformis f. sp. tritici PST-130]
MSSREEGLSDLKNIISRANLLSRLPNLANHIFPKFTGANDFSAILIGVELVVIVIMTSTNHHGASFGVFEIEQPSVSNNCRIESIS